MQDSDFVRVTGGLLSKAHYTYSNILLVLNGLGFGFLFLCLTNTIKFCPPKWSTCTK